MSCDIKKFCHLIQDNMINMPKSADYIVSRLCNGNYQACHRYRKFQEFNSMNDDLLDIDLSDQHEVRKFISYLMSLQN